MASTFSNYKIELIGTGDQAGTWGTTTNNNFQYAIEQAIGGYATQSVTAAPTTLSLTDANSLQNARALYLACSGTVSPFTPSTATPSLVVPAIQKTYIIKNDVLATLSGTYTRSVNTVTVTTASAHGLSNGNVVTLAFSAGTGGTATSGTYSVTSTGLTTFTITDPVGGTITGSGAVTIGYPLTVKIGTSTGTAVPYGRVMVLYANGTDVVTTNDYFSSILTVGSGNFGSSGSFGGSLSVGGNTTLSGNVSVGTTTTSSGTYARSGTTVTVTSPSHGFSNGQVLYLVFSAGTGGTATTGVYTISNVSTNAFDVTDTASGTITGTPAVDITKYNSTTTIQTPLSSFGSVGTSGYVLTSQGANVPPKWSELGTISGNLTVSGTATFNGNTTIGSTTVTAGTYGRSTTTVTVTSNSHGFSNGQVLYLVFSAGTGGTATSGVYAISGVATNTFNITDTASGTITGNPAVSITKYNNTATLQAPLSSFGSVGTSGFVLTSQGAGAPPQWVSKDTSTLVNGTTKLSVDSSGNFTSVVPSGSTLLPSFFPRAWVNFDGATAANVSGTYSQSGTTVTVTITGHGLIAGNVIYSDITSGTGVDGTYTVATVTDANTFTYTAGTSLTTSGNITLLRRAIRASGNVGSVTWINATGRFYINFSTAMPDADYAVSIGGSGITPAFGAANIGNLATVPTTGSFGITYESGGGTAINPQYGYVSVIR